MKIIHAIISVTFLSIIGGCHPHPPAPRTDLEKVDFRVHLEWNYDHSTDVVHGKLLRTYPMEFEGKATDIYLSDIEAIEVFKGPLEKGEIFTVYPIGVHENTEIGSEHLLLLNYYKFGKSDGYDEKSKFLFSNYRAIHNWFCALDRPTDNPDLLNLVMYDMVNSEQKTENYYLDSTSTFNELRRLKKEKGL